MIISFWVEGYYLADLGERCLDPVSTAMECVAASRQFQATKVHVEGNGHDLPFGCILDQSPNYIRKVYWNPSGVALSADSTVRQICRDGQNTLKWRRRTFNYCSIISKILKQYGLPIQQNTYKYVYIYTLWYMFSNC